MNRKKTIKTIVFLFLFLFAVSLVLGAPPTHRFDGNVSIDGNFSPSVVDNATVMLFLNGDLLTSHSWVVGNTSAGVNAGCYIANVPCNTGNTIKFTVNGVNVTEAKQTCSQGGYTIINISMNKSSTNEECTYGYGWSNDGCSSGLTCCSDNLCKSSCAAATTPSGGGGGGGTTTTVTSIALTETDTAYTGLARFNKLMFMFDGLQHTLKVNKIASDRKSAEFLLTSTPMFFTLNIGEEKIIDLDPNINEKLYIKLTGIKNRKVDIIVKIIVEPSEETLPPTEETVSGTDEIAEEAVEEEEIEEATPTTEKANPVVAWMIVALIVIVGLIIYFVVSKKKTA